MWNKQRMRRRGQTETVLVTGGAGYIGSVLLRRLLDRGYRIRLLDRLMYGDDAIREILGHPRLELVVGDLRDARQVSESLAGVSRVIHLGAIVGDPACALDEDLTVATNFTATAVLADLCRQQGVHRLVFASTCSVYGASERALDEQSALNPVSLYANTKIAAEQALLERQSAGFAPVILRFGTAYGASYRPRFDLVINLLTAKAVVDGQITIHGGSQWRPFVHVYDICQALMLALEASAVEVAGQILNIGSNDQNYQLLQVGQMIREQIPTAEVVTNEQVTDRRNYYVRFDKSRQVLGFAPERQLVDGVREIKLALENGDIGEYRDQHYSNHLSLSNLTAVAPRQMVAPLPTPDFVAWQGQRRAG